MSTSTKAYLAYAFVSIIWGTTYLAIKIGVEHFPPFLFAGFRQTISGLLMFLIMFGLKDKINAHWRNLLFQAFIGLLLITVGNGLVTSGERFISSSVAALICALMPLFAVLINLIFNKEEKLNVLIIVGMLLAFTGVAVLFKDNIAFIGDGNFISGIVMTTIATIGWALGSVLSRRRGEKSNALFNAGVQVTAGGLALLFMGGISGEQMQWAHQPAEAWNALWYLIVAGSILSYTAYMYMLKHLPVGVATSYAYINPLVAMIIGWLMANERFTPFTALSFLCIVGGVWVVNRGYKLQKKRLAAADALRTK